jgi:hypothetical protein
MASKTEHPRFRDFSQRLNEVCDKKGLRTRGRRQQIAGLLKDEVSAEAARKWLDGESMPNQEHMATLATELGTSVDWLQTGRNVDIVDPDRDPELSQLCTLWKALGREGRTFVLRAAANESIARAVRSDASKKRRRSGHA